MQGFEAGVILDFPGLSYETSLGEIEVKGLSGDIDDLRYLRIRGRSPSTRRGSLPSTVNPTFRRRS